MNVRTTTSVLAALCLSTIPCLAVTDLEAGDLALMAFNSDNPDAFAFVAWVDVEAGTEISFTDDGYKADGSWRRAETQILTWTNSTGGTVPAGTVVVIDGGVADLGNASGSMPYLSADGDQLFAFQGTFEGNMLNGTLIYGIDFSGAPGWDADSTSADTSALPPELSSADASFAVPEVDNAQFRDTLNPDSRRFADVEAAKAAVRQAQNWDLTNARITPLSSRDIDGTGSQPVHAPALNSWGAALLLLVLAATALAGVRRLRYAEAARQPTREP